MRAGRLTRRGGPSFRDGVVPMRGVGPMAGGHPTLYAVGGWVSTILPGTGTGETPPCVLAARPLTPVRPPIRGVQLRVTGTDFQQLGCRTATLLRGASRTRLLGESRRQERLAANE